MCVSSDSCSRLPRWADHSVDHRARRLHSRRSPRAGARPGRLRVRGCGDDSASPGRAPTPDFPRSLRLCKGRLGSKGESHGSHEGGNSDSARSHASGSSTNGNCSCQGGPSHDRDQRRIIDRSLDRFGEPLGAQPFDCIWGAGSSGYETRRSVTASSVSRPGTSPFSTRSHPGSNTDLWHAEQVSVRGDILSSDR